MARLRVSGTILVLVLVACSATESETTSTAGFEDQQPTSTTAEAQQTTEAIGHGPLFLRPVDPATLADSPDAAFFGVGASLWSAVSPSGQWLAAAGFSSTEGDDPTLRLIDSTTWTSSESLDVPQLAAVESLAVSDSGTVTWLRSETTGWQVYQLARGNSQPALVAEMEPFLRPIVQPAHIGALTEQYLAVAVHEFDGDHYGGETSIVIVDLTTGEVRTVPLEGVWSGHVPAEVDDFEGSGRSLGPGFGFDRDRDLLYAVSASADEIVVVDLTSSAITQRRDFHEPTSLLTRVLEWWVPKADAKVQDGSRRTVALSPDGSRLYVATARAESETIDGKFRWQDVPLGIEVIDTDSLNVIARSELPVSNFAISPDGSVLVAVGVHERDGDGYTTQGSGAFLLDPDDLSIVAHLDDGADYYPDGFSSDGVYAYVWSFSGNVLNHVAIDVSSGTSLASRNVTWPGYLIAPAGVVADKRP